MSPRLSGRIWRGVERRARSAGGKMLRKGLCKALAFLADRCKAKSKSQRNGSKGKKPANVGERRERKDSLFSNGQRNARIDKDGEKEGRLSCPSDKSQHSDAKKVNGKEVEKVCSKENWIFSVHFQPSRIKRGNRIRFFFPCLPWPLLAAIPDTRWGP